MNHNLLLLICLAAFICMSYASFTPTIWHRMTRVSLTSKIEEKTKAQLSLCQDLFPETADVIRKCSCELSCKETAVCCLDSHWLISQPINIRTYIRGMTKMMVNASFYKPAVTVKPQSEKYKPILSQEFLQNNGLSDRDIKMVPMVVSCPVSASKTEHTLCEKTTSTADHYLPVWVYKKNATNDFYRNEYCAKCHNVTKYNVTRLEILCSTNQNKSIDEYFRSQDRLEQCKVACFHEEHCRIRDGPVIPMSWHVLVSFRRKLSNTVLKEKVTNTFLGSKRDYYRLYCPVHETINFTNGHCIPLKNTSNQTLTNDTMTSYLPNRNFTAENYEFHHVVYAWEKKWEDSTAYISLVGSLFSVFCYFGLVIMFVRKGIKTLPVAKLIMIALWFTLMISDVILLLTHFTRENFIACKVTAILLHYTMLLSSFVAAIFAFEITKTFSGKMRKRLTKRKTFYGYIVIALMVSAAIILISVMLEEFKVLNIAYGEEEICWIGNMYGRLGFYLFPVISVYLLSIFAIICAIRNIQIVKKGTEKTMKKKENYSTKKIALKLIIYLGVVELIGVIQIEKDNLSEKELIFNAVFATLYVVTRSLKGLFMCMLFIANPRELYRQATLSRSTTKR